jgi:hypothetical protein
MPVMREIIFRFASIFCRNVREGSFRLARNSPYAVRKPENFSLISSSPSGYLLGESTLDNSFAVSGGTNTATGIPNMARAYTSEWTFSTRASYRSLGSVLEPWEKDSAAMGSRMRSGA